MKIIVHDYANHPFQVQLSREFARRGHNVLHLFCGYNITPQGKLAKSNCDPDNIEIKGIYTKKKLNKYSFVRRWFQEREYGKILAKEIIDFQPEVVISANTPLDAQKKLIEACTKENIQFVFWLMDFIGFTAKAILKTKLPVIGSLIGLYFIFLEKKLLLSSDKIIVTTEAHMPICRGFGVSNEKLFTIHNWAPIDDYPVMPRDNQWARTHKTMGKICFMWTGTLGMKHNPDLIFQLANKYRENENIVIIVTSESIGSVWLQKKKEKYNLSNLNILKFQPYDAVPNMMASSDILIAIVDKTVSDFAVPSKVLSYLCACKPIILAIDPKNLAAKILVQYHAGIVVDPDNIDEFLAAANKLANDKNLRDKMGKNGLRYAKVHFDVRTKGEQFFEIFKNN